MISLALASLMITSSVAGENLDKAAHFGVSWAINHTAYSVCEKITEHKKECFMGAAAGTLLIGVTKELVDGNKNTGEQHAKDMLANTAGVLASSLVITLTW